jgi:hypothetical protein
MTTIDEITGQIKLLGDIKLTASCERWQKFNFVAELNLFLTKIFVMIHNLRNCTGGGRHRQASQGRGISAGAAGLGVH